MPSLPPPRTTELYYAGAWHDISGDMREGTPVKISRGAAALGRRADPTAATATLDNRSGDYSPRNPLSDLFGKIGRNTPWRFSVDAGGPRLDLASTAYTLSTPDAASLDILGDLDVRIDVAPTTWTSGQMLVNRYAVGGNLAWSLMLAPDGHLILNWSATGLSGTTWARSTAPVPGNRRHQLRVTLDVNNGASGSTTTFYVGAGHGGWVQLGDPVVRAGTTSIYNATAPLHIGDPVAIAVTPDGSPLGRLVGSVYGVQVYAGISGELRVDVAPETQAAAGASSFVDGTGRVWTLTGGAALSNRHVRMEGEVPAWPPSRDLSGADRTVQIAPAGIMRRLGSGNRPLDSALRRFIIGNSPVECWPLTDGEQATQGAPLLGSPPLASIGVFAPEWGKGSVASWIEPTAHCAEQTYGILTARPRALGASANWSVDFVRSGTGLSEEFTVIDNGKGSDSDPQTEWHLFLTAPLNSIRIFRHVRTTDAKSVSLLADIPAPGIYDKAPHHVRLTAAIVGSNVAWTIYVDGDSVGTGTVAGTSRAVNRVDLGWDLVDSGSSPELSLGYLTCWGATAPSAADVYAAMMGFPGETAAARMLRLSEENGVPASLVGVVDASEPLGVQEPQRYLEALDTIAASDLGMVLEQRDARALIYRPRPTLYNQVPTLVLDFANGEISAPFAPIDDDKLTENDVTVSRKGGASATAVRTDGPLSVDAIGRYDVAPDVSLATDAQTVQQAYWRMYVGTFDGLRYAKITINLANARAYAKVNEALAVDVGDLIRLQHLPADQQPGDVDLIVTGYEEEVGATAWTITYTCVPGEPWTVGIAGDPILGKADTSGSVLASSASATATTLSVTTTAGPRWVTGAPNSATDPGFEQGTGTWACTRGASIGVVSWERRTVHSGTGAARITRVHPTDTGTMNMNDSVNGLVPAAAGQVWRGSAWVLSGGATANAMRAAVIWRDSVGVETNISGTGVSLKAGDGWAQVTVTATAPAGTASVRLLIEGRSAWTVGEWWVADDVRLARTDNLVGTDMDTEFPFDVTVGGEIVRVHGISGTGNSQTFYVNRSVNGIVKALASGTPLSLTHPMRAAL
ncbi:hypothetical protein E6R60_05915 [Streptomyces sp. A0642]|uniref:hypothetical protein n=1 Tax=Streptomyces sp. A0642 TaxID=2563100 RepID=UPI0010A28526|nr:hypothetical protein [Streptomyces sp. A0642]THA78418.1 hypothetical protein E6R60_05915 [Streptomyces sp. A0642]